MIEKLGDESLEDTPEELKKVFRYAQRTQGYKEEPEEGELYGFYGTETGENGEDIKRWLTIGEFNLLTTGVEKKYNLMYVPEKRKMIVRSLEGSESYEELEARHKTFPMKPENDIDMGQVLEQGIDELEALNGNFQSKEEF